MNNFILARIRWPRPFAGLREITLADVPREVSAGVTLAALMIPLNIGYAQVAGLPPVAGLYAAIIPLAAISIGMIWEAVRKGGNVQANIGVACCKSGLSRRPGLVNK